MALSQFGNLYAPDTYEWYADPAETQYGGAWRHKATGSFVGADAFKNYSQQAVSTWNSPYQAPAQTTQPQMTTPSTGGTNSAGSQPTTTTQQQQQPASVWDMQPKPANALMTARTSQFGAISGAQPQPAAPAPAPAPVPAPTAPVSTMDARQRYNAGFQPTVTPDARAATFNQIQNFVPPSPPSTPAATGFTEAPGSGGVVQPTPPVNALSGRGDYMGYGPNGGGLRVDPNYLPEQWNYQESPEYLWRQQQAERGLNRLLLNRGRSDSLGGLNALANQRSQIAGEEVDKQYQRALAANTANYARYLGANVENYGRTRGEDETAYGRAMGENVLNYNRQYQLGERDWNRDAYVDQTQYNRQYQLGERDWNRQFQMGEQDWNRNFALAGLGYNATQSGVQSGNAASFALATLLSQNGANQASLALTSGAVSADTIKRLLDIGMSFTDIEGLFGSSGGAVPQGYNPTGATAPALPAPSVGGLTSARNDYAGGYADYEDIWSRG